VICVGTTSMRALESAAQSGTLQAGERRAICSSCPATASRWPTRWSPTSTCPNPPC
jgi:hypothetical protein